MVSPRPSEIDALHRRIAALERELAHANHVRAVQADKIVAYERALLAMGRQ